MVAITWHISEDLHVRGREERTDKRALVEEENRTRHQRG